MQDPEMTVAGLMSIAARTAPKALGQDYITVDIIAGDKLVVLADAMLEYGRTSGKKNFDRDGESVRKSSAVLLFTLKENMPIGVNCGACGSECCSALKSSEGPEFEGPLCAWRVMDLGVAIGSAAKTAGILNVDSRIMYRPAVVARKLGWIKGPLAVAIPIAAGSKSIYFDRVQ